jgi:hypothetical protein
MPLFFERLQNEWKYGEFGHTSLRKTFVKIAQLRWDRKKLHHASFKKTYGKFTKWMKIHRSWHCFPKGKHPKLLCNGWKYEKHVCYDFSRKACVVIIQCIQRFGKLWKTSSRKLLLMDENLGNLAPLLLGKHLQGELFQLL